MSFSAKQFSCDYDKSCYQLQWLSGQRLIRKWASALESARFEPYRHMTFIFNGCPGCYKIIIIIFITEYQL